jgi:hypothetical protein
MWHLLRSDHLQCLSENDVFVFFSAWVRECQHRLSSTQLATLVRQLRFRHMDLHFVGHVVASNKHLKDARLHPEVMRRALEWRGLDADSAGEGWGERASNRGAAPEDARWTYTTSISLADCLALAGRRGSDMMKGLQGLAAGYRLSVFAQRLREAGSTGKLYIYATMRPHEVGPRDVGSYPLDDGCPLDVLLQVGGDVIASEKGQWLAERVYEWDEVVREGSPLFRAGKMDVVLTARLRTKA